MSIERYITKPNIMKKDHMLPSKKSKSTHTHKHILQPTFVWQPNLYQKSIQSNSFHSSSSTKTPLPKLLIPTPTPASHHSCWLVNAISCGPVGYTTLLPSSADHILPATSDTTSWDPLSWCPMVIVDCPEKVPFNFCGGFCHIWGGVQGHILGSDGLGDKSGIDVVLRAKGRDENPIWWIENEDTFQAGDLLFMVVERYLSSCKERFGLVGKEWQRGGLVLLG